MSVRRVAILGAESSGKSTLAAALAEAYATVWVPEYLREFVETRGRVPFESDQYLIARTQMQREEEGALRAKGFLFCDTTPLMTALYSRHYWGRVDQALAALEQRHEYALTLVTVPDSPWVADGLQRESAAVRDRVHEELLAVLAQRRIEYLLVSGSPEKRLGQVQRLLEEKKPC